MAFDCTLQYTLIGRSVPLCSFALQGPKAAQVLAKLIDQSKRSVDLAKISFGESFGAHIGGAECFVSRQSQTETLGFTLRSAAQRASNCDFLRSPLPPPTYTALLRSV